MKPVSNLAVLMTLYIIIAMAKAMPVTETNTNAFVQRDDDGEVLTPPTSKINTNDCKFTILGVLT